MNIRYRSRSSMNPVAGIIVAIVVSLAFIVIGVIMLNSNLELVNDGIKTEATVIDYRRNTSGKSVTYNPVVEFVLTNGETIQSISNMGSSNRGYAQGQKIGIVYMEDDPDNFVINSFFQVYGFPGIFILLGAVVLFFVLSDAIKRMLSANTEQTPYNE